MGKRITSRGQVDGQARPVLSPSARDRAQKQRLAPSFDSEGAVIKARRAFLERTDVPAKNAQNYVLRQAVEIAFGVMALLKLPAQRGPIASSLR